MDNGHEDHSNPYRPRLQHESRVAAFGADKFTVGASQTPRGRRISPQCWRRAFKNREKIGEKTNYGKIGEYRIIQIADSFHGQGLRRIGLDVGEDKDNHARTMSFGDKNGIESA